MDLKTAAFIVLLVLVTGGAVHMAAKTGQGLATAISTWSYGNA